jgi:hypothetical protein
MVHSSSIMWPFFSSGDLLSCLSPLVSADELCRCSTLNRSLRAFFDSELVWANRLRHARALLLVPGEADGSDEERAHSPHYPVPVPLPSALHHISQFVAQQEGLVSGLVYEPSRGLYHVHWTAAAPAVLGAELVMISYTTVRLVWRQEAAQWHVLPNGTGLLSVNVCNAHTIQQEEAARANHIAASSSSSSKQQYIQLMTCSAHHRRGCYRLLAPCPPLPAPSPEPKEIASCIRNHRPVPPPLLPPLSPLALCSPVGMRSRSIYRPGATAGSGGSAGRFAVWCG